ncbi:MAG: hypothetical protein AMXMBFR36_30080 [Acidobacteriota bacterium]
MNGDLLQIARLLGAMALALALAFALARGLGRPLRRESAIAAVVLPLVLLFPWIGGDRLLLPTGNLARGIPGTGVAAFDDPYARVLNDVSLQFAPWEMEVRRQFAAGHLPLWSDRVNGGSSPLANPQAAVLSPISMLARLVPVRHHFLAQLALRIQLALLGTWIVARMLGTRRPAALLGASAFAAGGGILAWGLFPHGSALAWSPWCVAAGLALARRPRPRTWATGVGIVTALMLSGQPEIAFAAGSLTAAVAWLYGRRRMRLRGVGRVAVVGALAFGLAAPALVPFLAVVGDSQRTLDREVELHRLRDETRAGNAHPWVRTFYARILLAPFTPWPDGVPFSDEKRPTAILVLAGYTGLIAIAGLVSALTARAVRRRALPLALLALAVYLLGSRMPWITSVWIRTPVLQLQEPTRMIPLGAMCLAVVGALGLGALARRRRPEAVWNASAIAVVLAIGCAIAPTPGVVAVSAALVIAALATVRVPRFALAILALALVADEIPWARRLLPAGEPGLFYPATRDMKTIVRVAGGPGGRAVGHHRLAYPGIFSTYGLDDPRTHDPLAAASYHRVLDAAFGFLPDMWNYFGRFDHPEHPMLDFLGVRAVVSNHHLAEIPGMRKLALRPPLFVAVNRDALPRAFVTTAFDIVPTDDLPDWIATMTDPRRVALDPEEVAARALPAALREGRADVLAHGDGRLAIEVRGRGARLLATSIRGPEGWRARAADGRTLETMMVNGAFLSVIVPSNVGRVELVYRPPGLTIGLILAAASGIALVALLVGPARRSRSPRAS